MMRRAFLSVAGALLALGAAAETIDVSPNLAGEPYNGRTLIAYFADAACTKPIEAQNRSSLFIKAVLMVDPAGIVANHAVQVAGGLYLEGGAEDGFFSIGAKDR